MDPTISIPFNAVYQSGLLYLLIKDFDFLKAVLDDLQPALLDAGESHIKLLKIIKNSYKQTKRILTVELIRNNIIIMRKANILSDGDVFGITSILDSAKTLTESDYIYIKEKCYDFLKKQTMAIAFSKSIDAFEQCDYDKVYDIMGEAYKKNFGSEFSIGIDYLKDSVCDRYLEAPRKGLWQTGFPTIDQYMGGGLAEKEALAIISSTGRGKSSMLANLAVTAAKQNKKTLFVTLEMSELIMAQRFDSIISGFCAKDLSSIPEAKIALQRKLDTTFNGNISKLLTVKGFDRGTLSLGAFDNYLERFSNDFGAPSCIIADWVGCFKMATTFDKRYEAIAEISDGLINLSRKYNCTMLTAFQSNRSAVGQSNFNYDSVSESFSALFGLDAIWALGSSEKELDAGKRTITIRKNRFGPDSVSVNLMGNKPTEPLTFKFIEAPKEDEEEELLRQEEENKKPAYHKKY
jgi:hypothetical protein